MLEGGCLGSFWKRSSSVSTCRSASSQGASEWTRSMSPDSVAQATTPRSNLSAAGPGRSGAGSRILLRTSALLLLLALSSCKGGDGGDTPADKSLFSAWSRQNPTGFILDFSGMAFGANTLTLAVSSPFSATCQCALGVSGSQSSGDYVISGCVRVTGTGTTADCQTFESNGTYTKTSDTLTVCNTSHVCGTYK